MANQRDRIIELKKYLVSLGIDIKIGKNKARGHKGIFVRNPNSLRIDISKSVNDENILSVMLHEFAHYLHYTYDSTLKKLDFIFEDFSDEIREELIKITVLDVPKDFASSLYEKKRVLETEIKELCMSIKHKYPDFKLSDGCKTIERGFVQPIKYLLKYDRVKFLNKLYSIDNINDEFSLNKEQKDYITLKSKQRFLRRINSKISKINKYYNNPSELFARFIEMYYTQPDKVCKLAPKACNILKNSAIPQLKQIEMIING